MTIPVLEHEVLRALKYSGLKINQTGSENAGYEIIDKFVIENASINYSTLCDFLNNPDKYLNTNNPLRLNSYKATTKEITFKKFSREDIEKAVYILITNGDIEDTNVNIFNLESRRLKLITKGLSNFYSEYYIKQKNEEIRFKKSQRTTRILSCAALSISIVALVPSSINTYYVHQDHTKKDTTITTVLQHPLDTLNKNQTTLLKPKDTSQLPKKH